MRDALNNALGRVLPACASALLAGCTVDLSGLNQLLDPDPTYLSLPGRLVASGEYSNAAILGTDFEGAYVTATKWVDGGRTFTVTPFEGGNTCSAGAYTGRYRDWLFGYRNRQPVAFALTRTVTQGTENVSQLHFVDSRCEELLPAVDSGLPFWPGPQPFENAPGYLTLERDGDFLRLEPWNRESTTIARKVRAIVTSTGKFWSLERPQDDLGGPFGMVVRNDRFKDVGGIENVQEFVITTDAQERVAYIQDDQLFVAKPPEFEPQGPIDSDVCRPRFPGGFRGRGISYYSPCDAKTVNIYGSARLSDEGPGKSDRKYVLKSGAVGDPRIQFLGDRAVVFLETSDGGDPERLTLWAGYLGEELERVTESPRQEEEDGISVWSVNDEFQLLIDTVDGVGRVVRWKPGSEVRDIATGVNECQDFVCLVNWDGETGDVVRISSKGGVRTLASRVPEGGFRADDALAIITDYDVDAGVGTLLVGSAEGNDLEQVATGVQVGGYMFLQNLEGIAYLRNFDPKDGTGAIGMRTLQTGDVFDTGVRASEFREIGWPRPGLLYVVPEGDRQGIWFAALL